jgi:hypothetical protein
MVRVEDFDGVDFRASGTMRAWRPAQPLEAGRYRFSGAPNIGPSVETFFVDPELVEPVPEIERADFRVKLDDPDEDEGMSCIGDSDSCDDIDFSQLTIEFSAVDTVAGALIEVTFPRRAASIRVLSGGTQFAESDPTNPDSLRRKVLFFDAFGGLPESIKKTTVCIALIPVGDGGSLGERFDLGCARPNDEDPRVTDTRGCASSEKVDLTWVALALVIVAGRGRRKRAFHKTF